jgi:hypothetical protein
MNWFVQLQDHADNPCRCLYFTAGTGESDRTLRPRPRSSAECQVSIYRLGKTFPGQNDRQEHRQDHS